ncbi:unnamed protein product [Didymodactylos carnosus]|nr:unnamed protein product [Didymodactylos carnosus]CAF3692752.1 unnamed protein product [Didymodactylos carnosus]
MLGSNFLFFGIEVLDRLFRGINWDSESRLFPKTTMCDFTIREFGHPKLAHEYTVPCVLPLNLFNQQMFTFLYFWYALIIQLNMYDFFLWIYTIHPSNRRHFIFKHLKSKKYAAVFEATTNDQMKAFVDDYLKADGVFILIIISENSSDFVTSEIIQQLWMRKFIVKYYRDTKELIYADIQLTNNNNNHSSVKRHLCGVI